MEEKTELCSNELNNDSIRSLAEASNFAILPCETTYDFEDKNRFIKLQLGTAQKVHLSALAQQIPNVLATGAMAQAYTVRFPLGLPHTLTALHQGGFGSMIRQNGQFVGSASFYAMTAQAAVMGAFTAMSVASGQYFLAQINSEMQMMRMKLDEILEFLYGDKKAELMSEMSFIRYAYQNFNSIMAHEQQRVSTIVSLQESRKVAMKDIEFYVSDLDATVSRKSKDATDLNERINKAFQIKDSLELSQQLYVMSSMMEVYYAQNMDPEYLNNLEKDMLAYIDKCDKRLLGSFGTLKGHIVGYKPKPMEKYDKAVPEKQVTDLIDTLNSGEESEMRKAVRSALHAASRPTEYYLSGEGNVYIKAS